MKLLDCWLEGCKFGSQVHQIITSWPRERTLNLNYSLLVQWLNSQSWLVRRSIFCTACPIQYTQSQETWSQSQEISRMRCQAITGTFTVFGLKEETGGKHRENMYTGQRQESNPNPGGAIQLSDRSICYINVLVQIPYCYSNNQIYVLWFFFPCCFHIINFKSSVERERFVLWMIHNMQCNNKWWKISRMCWLWMNKAP